MPLLCCFLVVPWLIAVAGRNPMENPEMFEGDMLGVVLNADRNAVPYEHMRWPDGVIPYLIDSNLPEENSEILKQAINYIQERTCVKFVPKTDEVDYVRVIYGTGCYAHWGRQGRGEQEVSLGEGCDNLGIGIHELLHAVGFEHEHNRSDRDDYVYIYWDNIPTKWHYAFQKLKPYNNWLLTPFDYDSIMLYGSGSYGGSEDNYSMVAKNGMLLKEVTDKIDMSPSDIRRVKILYQCR